MVCLYFYSMRKRKLSNIENYYPNKKLKINHKVVLDKGKSVQTQIDHLENSDEGNSTSSINFVAGDSCDIVFRSMHGVVNLHDNNLPARYSYSLPADYQELISQYCDI